MENFIGLVFFIKPFLLLLLIYYKIFLAYKAIYINFKSIFEVLKYLLYVKLVEGRYIICICKLGHYVILISIFI
jgi:hypothetical protein